MYTSRPYSASLPPEEPTEPAAGWSAQQMRRVFADMRGLLADRTRHLKLLAEAHREALIRLAVAAECRDGDTGLHIVRIGQLAGLLAERITGDRDYAELLCHAAPMHDVGKIGIPDIVLKKPGALTADEWQVMQQHPALGARILGGSGHPLFALAAEVAMTHHEKFDGSGYPQRLAGGDIPLSARIVSVVDFYDALTMDRCYRPRQPDDAVLRMMADESGHKFDPAVVDAFFQHFDAMRTLKTRVDDSFGDLQLEVSGMEAFEPMF